jgi:hypothetical protein
MRLQDLAFVSEFCFTTVVSARWFPNIAQSLSIRPTTNHSSGRFKSGVQYHKANFHRHRIASSLSSLLAYVAVRTFTVDIIIQHLNRV